MRISRYREPGSIQVARKNRREIIAAQLSRRDMVKFGLIGTSGYLAFKHGLSHWASGVAWARGGNMTSPPTRAFIEPMPIMPVRRPVSVLTGPAPTIAPNAAAG